MAKMAIDEEVGYLRGDGGTIIGSNLRHGGAADQEVVKIADEIGAGLIVIGS